MISKTKFSIHGVFLILIFVFIYWSLPNLTFYLDFLTKAIQRGFLNLTPEVCIALGFGLLFIWCYVISIGTSAIIKIHDTIIEWINKYEKTK